MADHSMALLDTLRKATESGDGDVDIRRLGVRILAQAIMEAEVSGLTGLPKGERDPERRLTHRNGYRERRSRHPGRHDRARHPPRPRRQLPPLAPRAPAAALSVPSSPSFLEASVSGVSTRRVDDLVRALLDRGRQPQRGQPDLRCPRCRGRGVPVPLARGRGVPVPVARCDVRQGRRGRSGRLDGAPRRGRRRPQRRAPGARARAQRGQRRGQRLAAVHPLARRARPRWRASGDQRRPPGPRPGDRRAAPRRRVAAPPGSSHAQRPGPRAPLGPEQGHERARDTHRAARRDERSGASAIG